MKSNTGEKLRKRPSLTEQQWQNPAHGRKSAPGIQKNTKQVKTVQVVLEDSLKISQTFQTPTKGKAPQTDAVFKTTDYACAKFIPLNQSTSTERIQYLKNTKSSN